MHAPVSKTNENSITTMSHLHSELCTMNSNRPLVLTEPEEKSFLNPSALSYIWFMASNFASCDRSKRKMFLFSPINNFLLLPRI